MVSTKEFVVKNGLIVNTAFLANSTQVSLGSNVVINTTAVFIGNSSQNTYVSANGIYINGTALTVNSSFVQNTDSRVLSGNLHFTGANNTFDTAVYVGGNVQITTSSMVVGNSTANAVQSAAVVSISNTSSAAQMVPTGITAGNTTANGSYTYTSISLANSSANTLITPSSIILGNTTANANISAISVTLTNSTSQSVINSSGFSTGNSTVNTQILTTYLTVANSTATSNITPTSISVGNSSVNAIINSTSVFLNGTVFAAPLESESYNGIQINGSMDVSQMFGSLSNTLANLSAAPWNYYNLDMWRGYQVGSMACTSQQIADAPAGLTYSYKFTVGTAEASLANSHYTVMQQPIEGTRIARLGWGTASAQPLSFGFWCKTHRPGLYSGSISNAAQDRSYVFAWTQNVADTWEWKPITITGDTSPTWPNNNTIGLYITFTMALGSGTGSLATTAGSWQAGKFLGSSSAINGVAATSDAFQITGVIILPGIYLPSSTQMPNIMRPFNEELYKCLRYYEKSYNYGVWPGTVGVAGFSVISGGYAGGSTYGTVYYHKKRTVPTFTTYSLVDGLAGDVYDSGNGSRPLYAAAVTESVCCMEGYPNSGEYSMFYWVADARM